MMLTTHFSLAEMTRSATATHYGISNTPGKEAVENLRTLCREVLQPLRNHLGRPIVINSGYRCKALNDLIGGAKTSQHLSGKAADIKVASYGEAARMAEWIMDNCQFDQMLLETSGKTYWLHVSYSKSGNRRIFRTIKA